MSAVFIWNVALAFIVGGVYIAVSTLAADRFGSRVGGFIAALPSTVVVALFFIGWGQGLEAAVRAAGVVPLSFANTGLFLLWFVLLARRKFGPALAIALLAWFVFAAAIALVRPSRVLPSLAVYLLTAAASWLVFRRLAFSGEAGHVHHHLSAGVVAVRTLFGGALVAAAVVLSKTAGPLFGGISAAFPAVFLSSLFFGYREHGLEFAKAMAVAMWRVGIVAIPSFALAAWALFRPLGLPGGTLAAFAISAVFAFAGLELRPRRPS
ncbi:MAG: DUF3147 family protein [Candidatus Aminicenantes bacterium]|nr:DUF3147 family protein [Candidatus Aminicenantes bacterium]